MGWFIIVYCLIAQYYAQSGQSTIMEVTSSNFAELIENNNNVFLSYDAKWCPHCKSTNAELVEMSADLKRDGFNIIIGVVDSTNPINKELVENQNITGYPTLMFYSSDKKVQFYGNRKKAEMISFIKRKSGPSSYFVTKLDDFADRKDAMFAENPELFGVVLAVFPPSAPESNQGLSGLSASLFQQLSENCDQIGFIHSDGSELIKQFSISEDTMFIFPNDGDCHTYVSVPFQFENGITYDKLSMEVHGHLLPAVLRYSAEVQPLLHAIPLRHHALIFYDEFMSNIDKYEALMSMIKHMSKRYHGKLLLILVDKAEQEIMQYFGVTQSDLPRMVFVDMKEPLNMKKFELTDYLISKKVVSPGGSEHTQVHQANIFDQDDVFEFLRNNLMLAWGVRLNDFDPADMLSRSLNSESLEHIDLMNDMPPEGSESVINIISKNFNERVIEDNTIDAFVYFYAPWCGHCKSVEPIISELADSYRHDPTVQIFRMDATKNEIDHRRVRVRAFPTFYYFPAGSGKSEPMEYDGPRTTAALRNFVNSFRSYVATQPATAAADNEEPVLGAQMKCVEEEQESCDMANTASREQVTVMDAQDECVSLDQDLVPEEENDNDNDNKDDEDAHNNRIATE